MTTMADKKSTLLAFCQQHATKLLALILAGLTFFVYSFTLRYGFFFDDLPTIIDNAHIGTIDLRGHFFVHTRWIPRLCQQLLYHWSESNPFGYRIAYLFMHIGIGLMLFAFLLRVFSRWQGDGFFARHATAISFVAAALFLLHPAQSQTVIYITQIGMEGMAAFFIMLTTLLFQSWVLARGWAKKAGWLAATFVSALFATGTKEVVLVLPFLLFLADLLLLRGEDNRSFRLRLPIHLLLALVVFGNLGKLGLNVARIVQQAPSMAADNNRGNVITQQPDQKITPLVYLISQPKVIWHYLSIFFLPVGLSFDYDTRLSVHWADGDVLAPAFFFLLLGLGMAWAFIRQKWLPGVFALAWFFVSILPRASFLPTQELVCDYKTYIGSLGLALLLSIIVVRGALWLAQAASAASWPMVRGVCAVVVCSSMAATLARSRVWSSELALWKDVIEKAPKKSRAYNNYAVCLFEQQNFPEAIEHYKKAIELDRSYGEPHANLAYAYQTIGDVDNAMKHYDLFLDTGEMHPNAFTNMGAFYADLGMLERAEIAFDTALQARPTYARAAIGKGRVFCLRGEYDRAITALQAAEPGRDCREERYFWLGSAHFHKGELAAAQPLLEVLLFQQDPRVGFMLGCCYYEAGRFAEAAQQLSLAQRVRPGDHVVTYNLAMACLKAGDARAALAFFQQCGTAMGSYPFLPLHQAVCLAELGDKHAAIELCQQAVKTATLDVVREDCLSLIKALEGESA